MDRRRVLIVLAILFSNHDSPITTMIEYCYDEPGMTVPKPFSLSLRILAHIIFIDLSFLYLLPRRTGNIRNQSVGSCLDEGHQAIFNELLVDSSL